MKDAPDVRCVDDFEALWRFRCDALTDLVVLPRRLAGTVWGSALLGPLGPIWAWNSFGSGRPAAPKFATMPILRTPQPVGEIRKSRSRRPKKATIRSSVGHAEVWPVETFDYDAASAEVGVLSVACGQCPMATPSAFKFGPRLDAQGAKRREIGPDTFRFWATDLLVGAVATNAHPSFCVARSSHIASGRCAPSNPASA